MSLPLPPNVTDLRGRTFGRLKVREFAEIRNNYAYWSCDCDCGTVGYVVRGKNLLAWEKAGRAISCGCYRKDPVARQAARLTMTPEARKLAAGGVRVRAEKPAPKPRAPRPKKILPLTVDPGWLLKERATEQPITFFNGADEREADAITRPAPTTEPHTVWAAITRDRHGGYRVVIRLDRANNTSAMTSRRLTGPSDARREARRLFGERLNWMTGYQAGLHNQPWVLEIAELHCSRGPDVS